MTNSYCYSFSQIKGVTVEYSNRKQINHAGNRIILPRARGGYKANSQLDICMDMPEIANLTTNRLSLCYTASD